MGIVHDTRRNEQSFLMCGTNDIISIVVHPDGAKVYLGEQAERPAIYVWDTSTYPYKLITTIKKCLRSGVESLEINSQGYLLAGCIDAERTLAIFSEEENYACIYTVKLGGDQVCSFDPTADHSLPEYKLHGSVLQLNWVSSTRFVLTGNGEPQLRSISNDEAEVESFPMSIKSSVIILCAVDCPNGDMIFGTSNGDMIVWQSTTADSTTSSRLALHKGSLDALAVDMIDGDRYVIVTGGKDGVVNVFDDRYVMMLTIDIYSLFADLMVGQIRAIAMNGKAKKMAIGVISGEIYEINYE